MYCPTCKEHQEHKLKLYTVVAMQNARTMAMGVRKNVRKHKKGYGGKSKHTKKQKKQTRKPTFMAECQKCKKKHYFVIPKRMKKVELK